MSLSSGGVSSVTECSSNDAGSSSTIRPAPFLYLPPVSSSPVQGIDATVKILPSSVIQRPPNTLKSSPIPSMTQDVSTRGIVLKGTNPSKSSPGVQVLTNSSSVIRTMPTVIMGGGQGKKVVTVANNLSFMDSKSLKYIGTFIKNKKVDPVTSQANQNVVIVSSPSPVTSTLPTQYIVTKAGKASGQNVMLTPISNPQNKSKFITYPKASLPNKIVVQPNGSAHPVTTSANDRPYIIKQKTRPVTSSVPNVLYFSPVDMVGKKELQCPDLAPLSRSSFLNEPDDMEVLDCKTTPKFYVPVSQTNSAQSNTNNIFYPIKVKKADEPTRSRLQGTDLNRMVSNTAGTTNFQITNGQVVEDSLNTTVPLVQQRRASLLLDQYPKVEIASCSPKEDDIILAEALKSNKPDKFSLGILKSRRKSDVIEESVTNEMELVSDDVQIKLESVPVDIPDVDDEVMSVTEETKSNADVEMVISLEEELVEATEVKQILDEAEEELKKIIQEEFDPITALDWNGKLGDLISSDLKFKVSDFGLLVLSDDTDDECKVNLVDIESDLTEQPSKPKKDKILCCQSCGTYGMYCEFVNSRFCSKECTKLYAEERAEAARKLMERQEKRSKIREQKMKLLQQRAHLEKLGLHEAKFMVDEKLKMLRMEKEVLKINGDSDCESGSGSSQNIDGPKSSEKRYFCWNKYLTVLKAKGAPSSLFKDPFPSGKNNFKIGMKLEGIDPIHPSLFCVLTVTAVLGYRIKLHFDGYSDVHDFWVNANSNDIFHAGWCERTNHKLSGPRGYGEKSFNWGNYLRITKTIAAPKPCFVNNQEKNIIPCGFRIGMKLEAVDKKNSSLICVATITDVLDNRILIHFDSWDDIYDYWADTSSPYIHHVGWCKENGHQLTPPNSFDTPTQFNWEDYLRETKSQAAPARAFKPRTPPDFRRGMKLECVDKRNTMLIRVATVVDTAPHQIKIKFDGWPDQYGYWVDDDEPDIHPPGWCQKTNHPLEPLPSEDDIRNTTLCPTPGCRGAGHAKRQHNFHNMTLNCPYSSMNYLRDDLVPDRFCSRSEYYEVKETSLSKGTKPRPGISRKMRYPDGSEQQKVETRGRKRKSEKALRFKNKKIPKTEPESPKPAAPWYKDNTNIGAAAETMGDNPYEWTLDEVSHFVQKFHDSEEKGKIFTEQQIDGEALLMLSQSDLVQFLGFKLGPAIKLSNCITLLRQRALELKHIVSS